MLKKIIMGIVTVCMLAMVPGCQSSGEGTASNTDAQNILVAFNQNENHPQYKAMKKLGDEFEKATDGRYKMTIYPNGILGEQGSMAEFVRTGALQMAIVPCSVPEGYDKDFAMVGAPYLYDDIDHLERATLGGVFDNLFKNARKYNFQVMTVYTAGERNVYSDKPINSAADLKGQIVRVNDSPTYIEMVKLMGGTGAVMSQSEVYTALQQGVIDAGENSELVYNDFKHYEVAPYYSYTKHIVHPDVVIASTDFLDSMNEADRELFEKLIDESTQFEFDTFKQRIEEAKEEVKSHGTQFCYPDVEEFRTLCQPLLDRISQQSDTTKQIYNDILALRGGKQNNE